MKTPCLTASCTACSKVGTCSPANMGENLEPASHHLISSYVWSAICAKCKESGGEAQRMGKGGEEGGGVSHQMHSRVVKMSGRVGR